MTEIQIIVNDIIMERHSIAKQLDFFPAPVWEEQQHKNETVVPFLLVFKTEIGGDFKDQVIVAKDFSL